MGIGAAQGRQASYSIPDDSLHRTECPFFAGLGAKQPQCAQVCLPRENGGLASGHLQARVGPVDPSSGKWELTKAPENPWTRLKCSWLKNGLVGGGCGTRPRLGRGRRPGVSCEYQRPRKALWHPNLLPGLVRSNSRAGGEVVLSDVIPQLGKFPSHKDKSYDLLIPSPCLTPSVLHF